MRDRSVPGALLGVPSASSVSEAVERRCRPSAWVWGQDGNGPPKMRTSTCSPTPTPGREASRICSL